MFDELSEPLTILDTDPDLWVGVWSFAGKHTIAGLGLPRFAGSMQSGERDAANAADDRVDAFALRRRCSKLLVVAVQSVTFTIGIEHDAGRRYRNRRRRLSFRTSSPNADSPSLAAHMFAISSAPAGGTRCITCSATVRSPIPAKRLNSW